MRVKITEKKLKDAGYDLAEGDSITVSDDLGRTWCGHGWAKDLDGKVASGERKVTGAQLQPQKGRHTSTGKRV